MTIEIIQEWPRWKRWTFYAFATGIVSGVLPMAAAGLVQAAACALGAAL